MNGQFAFLADIERDITLLQTQAQTVNEVQTQATSIQSALGIVQSQTSDLAEAFALASTTLSPSNRNAVSRESEATLGSIVSALNTTVAGRSLFSGTDVTTLPFSGADEILAGLTAAVAGATTASDILVAADAYFDTPGGGFESDLYMGGTTDLSAVDLGSGETVALDVRADNTVLRTVVKSVAIGALLEDLSTVLDGAQQQQLTESLAERTLTSQDSVTRLRADLGFAEERIAAALTRTATEIQAADIARGTLLDIDPFKVATDLEAVQIQLEMLYTITARSSRLSLVNFIS